MGLLDSQGFGRACLAAWVLLVLSTAPSAAAGRVETDTIASIVGTLNGSVVRGAVISAAKPKAAKKPAAKTTAGKKAKAKAAVAKTASGKKKPTFVGTARKTSKAGKKKGRNGGPTEARSKLDQTYKRSTGGGIVWNASGTCLPASVRNAIYAVAKNFGAVVVNSTGRGRKHNRRVGGAGKSMHLQCRAADFRVLAGRNRAVLAFLTRRPGLGGIKLYRAGYFHIDNGPRRTWKG